jgi:Planctomycete cytochrome C
MNGQFCFHQIFIFPGYSWGRKGVNIIMPVRNNLHRVLIFVILLLIFIFLTGCAGTGQPPVKPALSGTPAVPVSGTPGNVSFSKDIQPILQSACVSCHGVNQISRGLDMRSYVSLMKGSQNGAVVLSGNANNSLLIQSVESGAMPKRGGPLTSDQISLLVQWVNGGAKNN